MFYRRTRHGKERQIVSSDFVLATFQLSKHVTQTLFVNSTQFKDHSPSKSSQLSIECCPISNEVGRNDNFLVKARKLSILPTSLDISYIRQHFIRILYSSHNNPCFQCNIAISLRIFLSHSHVR